jgi:hypothetical protein
MISASDDAMARDEEPADISGLELSRQFHFECVEPLLREHLPTLRYASAIIGPGSEVLGFDDHTSRDHDWGPRLMLFLESADCEAHAESIRDYLRRSLPLSFRGYSTHWEEYSDDPGVSLPASGKAGDVNHRITVQTVEEYLKSYLGSHPLLGGQQQPQHELWLSIPQQKLRTVAEGAVFRDDFGTLTEARTAAAGYGSTCIMLFQRPRSVLLVLIVWLAGTFQRMSGSICYTQATLG